jgi:hypothetical protein
MKRRTDRNGQLITELCEPFDSAHELAYALNLAGLGESEFRVDRLSLGSAALSISASDRAMLIATGYMRAVCDTKRDSGLADWRHLENALLILANLWDKGKLTFSEWVALKDAEWVVDALAEYDALMPYTNT